MRKINRREFGAGTGAALLSSKAVLSRTPAIQTGDRIKPLVISDYSGLHYKNGGDLSCVEKAFQLITSGSDVLNAVIEGVRIVELDPTETGVGYGGLPNEEGVVQLDACCMHGPRKKAGGVAALEGVRTPAMVAKAVMENTDHHLLVGNGAREFARRLGFEIEEDLNTPRSRELWLEWKRRIDPQHYLKPGERAEIGYREGLKMVAEGLIPEDTFWGTVNCDGINSKGEICGVTTTSGLAFKIPGRAGDSPILGAGLYVDNEVGAVGSTGRGEANLYNLTCFLIVENLRKGLSPKDAGMEGLKRIRSNTVEKRLLNSRGEPAFNIRFFVLNKKGRHAGVTLYASGETTYSICTENGAESRPLEPLLEGSPAD